MEKGFALQLGTLGLIAGEGGFKGVTGEASTFESWSLAKADKGVFGYRDEPLKIGKRTTGLLPEEFLPAHEQYLHKAITQFIKGSEPFTARRNPDYPGYNEFDQLMLLEEWQIRLADSEGEGEP